VKKYAEFLESKKVVIRPSGIDVSTDKIHPLLFPFQRDIVRWALRLGKACIFADCGLGKTLMQLEWARHIGGKCLILTPLAVAAQTEREAEKIGISAQVCRSGHDVINGINIANYERLHKFDTNEFKSVILDESSILKAFDGKTRNQIIGAFGRTPYRLACTATPSPNDHMELGNHAEFIGVMSRTEMLSMFFVHDGGDTSKWRIKGHAEGKFWEWVASWACMLRKPSDLGYDDNGFILPELKVTETILASDGPSDGMLFPAPANTLQERRGARRASAVSRIAKCVLLIKSEEFSDGSHVSPKKYLIWCDLNYEQDAIAKRLKESGISFVSIQGSTPIDNRVGMELSWREGNVQVMLTKPSVFGHGMNWQHCSDMVFVGLSDSYEQFYQAVRRCWRFGQKNPVNVHVIIGGRETNVLQNVKRKEADLEKMQEGMVKHTHKIIEEHLKSTARAESSYATRTEKGDGWEMRLGDCIEEVRTIPSDSVHYSIFSPPFASLYTYSDSERDMGNCREHSEFYEHFKFLAGELYRSTRPGRLLSFHCMNLPASKTRDGYIGIHDFRGEMIRIFLDAGWIYHSEVCIWKDPVTAMQRTKALGLLHKQIRKDSTMSRQGIADYLVTMRKHGENPERVSHTPEEFPVSLWQRYASPVWMDINPSRTLQKTSAREEKDERHICPLQLDVIDRAIMLWTNPGDMILSPFAGIGSEGHQAITLGRRFLGIELKESYYRQAVLNLQAASSSGGEMSLFRVSK
jgi:superfamily II DNA or RNA helicase